MLPDGENRLAAGGINLGIGNWEAVSLGHQEGS